MVVRSSSGKGTVLVVDDDPDIRETLADLLRDTGYAVIEACNGQEALDILRGDVHLSAMLLDLMMPIVNGWQVLDAVRDEGLLAPEQIVVLTASPNAALPAEIRVLTKPASIERVITAVAATSNAAR